MSKIKHIIWLSSCVFAVILVNNEAFSIIVVLYLCSHCACFSASVVVLWIISLLLFSIAAIIFHIWIYLKLFCIHLEFATLLSVAVIFFLQSKLHHLHRRSDFLIVDIQNVLRRKLINSFVACQFVLTLHEYFLLYSFIVPRSYCFISM